MILVGQATIGPITAHYHNLDLRLKAMNRQDVTVHALSLNPPMVYWADGALGIRLARIVNDAMAEATRLHPDRFVALATLPMQDPEAAVTELNRAVTELGCRGIYLGTNIRGKELTDPLFLPVFERIQALQAPVFLHPLNVIGSQRLTNYYLHNLLGNPFDTAVAAANLIFSGLLDRFPKASNLPAACRRRLSLSHRPSRSRLESATGVQGAQEAPFELSEAFHLRHDQPRSGIT